MVSATDIANRALQRVGASRIAEGELFTEDSKNASEIRACYHMLRRAELRRNVWRFAIRTVAIRAIDTDTKVVTFPAYASGTTYAVNNIILATDGYLYSSLAAGNIGNEPSASPTKWSLWFGNTYAQEFVTTWGAGFTYAAGDHSVGSDGVTYSSVADANINHDPVGDAGVHWTAATDGTVANTDTFFAGELVYIGGTIYLSRVSSNEDVPPTSKWMSVAGATVAAPNFIYPIGAGPFSDTSTKNVYPLPNGYLREAPQNPKGGAWSFLGAPSGDAYKDWNFESNFIITGDSGAIVFRFCADIADTSQFDALFAEGFGSRIAFEICEPLTQSTSKISGIASEYRQFMTEARTVNGIETGPVQPPEDDYITCRV
jgi:hypothetical protein